MAAKFFTGLPLDGPDPECVRGFGEQALAARSAEAAVPRSDVDHSRRGAAVTPHAEGPGAAACGRPACRDSPTGRATSSPLRRGRAPAAHDRRAGDLLHMCSRVTDDVGRRRARLGERTWTEIDDRPTVLVPVGSSSSTARTCRWTPTRGSPPPSPARGGRRIEPAARPARRVRRVRGARGVRGHGVDRARGAAAAARRAGAFGRRGGPSRVVFVNGHGGNVPTLVERGPPAALRGPRRRLVRAARPRWRRPRGPHRDVDHARARPARACGPTRPRPATRRRCGDLLPALRAGGVAAVSPRTGCWATPRGAIAGRGRAAARGDGRRPHRGARQVGPRCVRPLALNRPGRVRRCRLASGKRGDSRRRR